MKRRKALIWAFLLLSLIALIWILLRKPSPPCEPGAACPLEEFITIHHEDDNDTTDIIVQLYPELKEFPVLGERDTVFCFSPLLKVDASLDGPVTRNKVCLTKRDPLYARYLTGGTPLDTFATGSKAFIEDLNNFLYEDDVQRITEVIPADTCRCDAAVFLLKAITPPGVDINSGIAAGTSGTTQDNTGAILAAGFNYAISLEPVNAAELVGYIQEMACPEVSKPTDGGREEEELAQQDDSEDNPEPRPNEKCNPAVLHPQSPLDGVTVAIVDTGMDPTYRYPNDLTGNLHSYFSFSTEINELTGPVEYSSHGEAWPGNGVDDGGDCFPDDYYGYDFFHDDNNPFDLQGHGSHIGHTVLTGDKFTSYPIRVMPLQFGGYRDGEFSCDLFAGICAINYATNPDREVDIINLSWGFFSDIFHKVLYQQLLRAHDEDILVVTSAGNNEINTDDCRYWPARFSQIEPLNANVVSVAALDVFGPGDTPELAAYSNYGRMIDLAAPGTQIEGALVGSRDQFVPLDGTSMAAAVVSRRAAMLRRDGNTVVGGAAIKQLLLGAESEANKLCCTGDSRVLRRDRDQTLMEAIGYE